jgi:hypothetical protein
VVKKFKMVPETFKLEPECDIQEKNIHFRDLLNCQYEQRTGPVGFYNQFRNTVIASLKKKGDMIIWQNDTVLMEDEQLSPTFEELILFTVLLLIDPSLPGQIWKKYRNFLGSTKSLMDYRDNILAEVTSVDLSQPTGTKNEDPLARYGIMFTCSQLFLKSLLYEWGKSLKNLHEICQNCLLKIYGIVVAGPRLLQFISSYCRDQRF